MANEIVASELSTLRVSHLHTFFLFAFAIDRAQVMKSNAGIWQGRRWEDGLDEWVASAGAPFSGLPAWQRAAYESFDLESRAYQDMVFFHPFVRRVFFDTKGMQLHDGEMESLLRCYRIPIPNEQKLHIVAEDERGRSTRTELTDLKLFLFANGIGVLSIGIESRNISVREALWINEMVRKVYPSSGRQLREGRCPSRLSVLAVDASGERRLVEERYGSCCMQGFLPPLSALITNLLRFGNYARHEYEPVLDERMIVNSYIELERECIHEEFWKSEAYDILFSRALYVDHYGEDYRYAAGFTRRLMEQQSYRRWAHQGTLYGFTSYSSLTMCLGLRDCDQHLLREGFLIHRMFESRYYLMQLVALFYRATLLDYAERTALVSRRLFDDFQDNLLSEANLERAAALRLEFLNFSNYWHFDELANKEEETEHFNLLTQVYRNHEMKREIETEIEKLNVALNEYYQTRSTQAVNRLAVVSTILGAGAVLTGYFGMNFGRAFSNIFFTGEPSGPWWHYTAIAFVSLFALGSIGFTAWLILSNREDYRNVLRSRKRREPHRS
jgi:hypothetical protein